MRAPLLIFAGWLACTLSLSGQIAIGGKSYVRSPAETGRKGEWILYERGAPQDEGSRRWLTKKVLVELLPGKAAAGLGQVAGVTKTEPRGKYAVIEFAGNADAALTGAERLRKIPGVRTAEPMLARQWFRRAIPNDPLFSYDAAKPGYQWHLRNTGQNGAKSGIDVNVTAAWDSYRGTGIRIGIVDDGLETTHPDLSPNVDLDSDFDFNQNDDDPSPGPADYHGTACAGVAAARGNNGIGVSGTAPEATLVGLRLIAEPTTDLQDADAFLHQSDLIAIKSNSWGPYDTAFGAQGPGPLAQTAIESAITDGRNGKGTVFLWAAGNGNGSGDDSNYDGWANSPQVIAVSAINDKGRASWYSEPGANILVCAPSNGGKEGITTTDRTGDQGYNVEGGTVEYPDFSDFDYTNTFGGTSSATPAVAGVVALMLQANPNLTYRDVQEILVRTAKKNDPYDGDWVTNGGGFHFNVRYGAGLIDAQAATSMAANWATVAAVQTRTIAATGLPLAIPDADETGLARTFTVSSGDNLRLEHVLVKIKVTHPCCGNLEWRLTSPSGVRVRLARARYNDTSSDLDWTLMTTHFWGERSEGDWKLEVADRTIDNAGSLEQATLIFRGTPADPSLPLPVITSNLLVVGREGLHLEHRITAANFPSGFDAGRYYPYWGLPAGLTLNPITGVISGMPTETGGFAGYQAATNATGTTWMDYTPENEVGFIILAADSSLSAATEQSASTKIIPFGYANPFSETATTHDNQDAIETGTVDDEEYSGIEFTVNGPARLDLQWKVSSEKDFDYMILAVDGYVRDYITGEVDWKPSTTYLGAGEHNVDIYYIKDEGVAKGQDRGWIDTIAITSTAGEVPAVTTSTVQAYQGVYLRWQLEATNAPTGWTADSLPAGLTLHPSGLIYGKPASLGTSAVTLHATNEAGTATASIEIRVGSLESGLAEAVDLPAQPMATSGDLPWIPQWDYASDREDAARSGPIGNLQSSVMTTQVTGPCKVVFYWGVSSEAGYDFLRFWVDDSEWDAISGEVGWTRKGFIIPAGEHTLKWSYTKDDFTASGLDSGLIDRLAIYPDFDADGDGVQADIEAWFGTSDHDTGAAPQVILNHSTNTSLQFPSVPGRDYRVEFSTDLVNWTPVTVTASGSQTTWTDLNATNKSRRFYRIAIP